MCPNYLQANWKPPGFFIKRYFCKKLNGFYRKVSPFEIICYHGDIFRLTAFRKNFRKVTRLFSSVDFMPPPKFRFFLFVSTPLPPQISTKNFRKCYYFTSTLLSFPICWENLLPKKIFSFLRNISISIAFYDKIATFFPGLTNPE